MDLMPEGWRRLLKFAIRNRFTREIILSGETDSLSLLFQAMVKPGSDLSGIDLPGANLVKAALSKVDLSASNLSGTNLTKADLTEADLAGSNLTQTIFTGAILTPADLTLANLTGADLCLANLDEASLKKADLLLDQFGRGQPGCRGPIRIQSFQKQFDLCNITGSRPLLGRLGGRKPDHVQPIQMHVDHGQSFQDTTCLGRLIQRYFGRRRLPRRRPYGSRSHGGRPQRSQPSGRNPYRRNF